MKMKPEHFEALEVLLRRFQKEDLLGAKMDYDRRGLSGRRYNFDVLWSIPRADREAWFKDNAIYNYLNDDHIGTALNVILGRILDEAGYRWAWADTE